MHCFDVFYCFRSFASKWKLKEESTFDPFYRWQEGLQMTQKAHNVIFKTIVYNIGIDIDQWVFLSILEYSNISAILAPILAYILGLICTWVPENFDMILLHTSHKACTLSCLVITNENELLSFDILFQCSLLQNMCICDVPQHL